jgi:hypothetical protein
MPQIVTCPECTKALQVPDELIGKTVQCPECKNTFPASLAAERDGDSDAGRADIKTTRSPGKDKKSKTKTRDRDDDDDDDRDHDDNDLDIAKRSRRRGEEKPGKVLAMGIMMLIGGIFAVLYSLIWAGSSMGFCCLWPGTYYSLVLGILAIIRASALLGSNAAQQTVPSGIAIMMIINIINGDVMNCVMGIICTIFCSDEEVTNYLAR